MMPYNVTLLCAIASGAKSDTGMASSTALLMTSPCLLSVLRNFLQVWTPDSCRANQKFSAIDNLCL
jgi:hypothetical protein